LISLRSQHETVGMTKGFV